MAIGRFERKIVFAIAAVAFMPLLGALVLGQRALQEAYSVGVNEQVESELDRGLSLYQAHFAALREDATRSAAAVAHDFELRNALSRHASATPLDEDELARLLDTLFERYRNVYRIELLRRQRPVFARERPNFQPDQLRLLLLDERLLPADQLAADTVRVTVGTDARAFGDYQRAGEVSEVFRTLKQRAGYVSGFYLAVYIALLLSVIVVALGIGVTLSRR